MKLVINAAEGEQYFDQVYAVPGYEIVRVLDQADLPAAIADADVYFGFPNSELMGIAPNLKWIQAPSAGVDFLMRVPELVENDMILTNTRGAHAVSIAEHTFGLLLSLTRVIPQCVHWQDKHYWARTEGYRLPREIMGSTMGIVGYGQIGRAVAKRAAGFDMRVLAVDVYPGATDAYCEAVTGIETLVDVAQQSDVLVIAAPYTKETRHVISDDVLTAMPEDGYLIVVSRGGVVDEEALVRTLDAGRLAGAALDVAETEPLPAESPLWNYDRVLLTPHLAGSSWQKERRVVEILIENLGRFQRGEELKNLVDKRAGF